MAGGKCQGGFRRVENVFNFGWETAGGKRLCRFWPGGFRLQAAIMQRKSLAECLAALLVT